MPKSSVHRGVVDAIRGLWPNLVIHEEHPIVVTDDLGGERTLFVDIYVPSMRLCVECQGRQHREYVQHFHGGPEGFARQLSHDRAKKATLEADGFAFVAIHDDSKITRKRVERSIIKAMKTRTKA